MRLPEYAGKAILAAAGVAIPDGVLLSKGKRVEAMGRYRVFEEFKDAKASGLLTYPAVVKCQTRHGGRKHKSLVGIVDGDRDAEAFVNGLDSRGYDEPVLIERMVDTSVEHYLSCSPDRARKRWTVLYSSKGGIDVEENGHILRVLPEELDAAEKDGRLPAGIASVARRMLDAAVSRDLTLLEVNPLSADLVALDCKAEADDDAIWRQPEFASFAEETVSRISGASVMLMKNGGVGILANGAGLTMATMDAVSKAGRVVGQAVDLAGSDSDEVVEKSYLAVLERAPDAILLNSFGGITRCTTVAKGLLAGISQRGTPPGGLVVRLDGNCFEEAAEMLRAANIEVHPGMQEAVKAVAEAGRRGEDR